MVSSSIAFLDSLFESVLGFARGADVSEPLRPDYATPGAIGDARLRRRRAEEQRVFGQRLRLGLLTCFIIAFGLAIAIDPFVHPEILWQLWGLKLAFFAFGAALWRTSHTASRRVLVRAAAAAVIAVAALACVSSILAGESWSAALVCILLTAGTPGLIPWGVRTQIVVAPFLFALSVIPMLVVGAAASDGFFVMLSLLFNVTSVLAAREHERSRRAAWQSLLFFRENMERLRQIAEHINGVLWLGERDDAWGEALLYVSPRYDDLWGLDRRDLQEHPDAWLEAVHPDDRARVAATFADARAMTEHDCTFRLLRADGTIRWIHDYGFPIRDVDGSTRRVARLSQDVTADRQAAEAQRMRDIARSVQAAQEDERRRIARELHDELGQALTGIKLRLAGITTGHDDLDAATRTASTTRSCMNEIDDAMVSVHGMIHRLHPPVLDDLGLVAALRMQADAFAQRTGITCALELPEREPELSRETLTAVFRVAQESLTNVARHAHASRVALRLTVDDGHVRLSVTDDGRGVDDAKQGFGTRGMGERAALLNGRFDVDSCPGGGTTVRLELPPQTPGDAP